MDKLQEMIISAIMVSSLTIILLISTSAIAAPVEKRSYHLPETINCEPPISVTVGDGLLRDMMMIVADSNHDGKLSETEITLFYRNVIQYTYYVARTYGRSFIEIADLDHDGLLDSDELLCMLGAMSASTWTRR